MNTWKNPLSQEEQNQMHPDALAIFNHYQMEVLPVEGTFYRNTYVSTQKQPDGSPIGTAMIGMYCNQPVSASCFHRLQYDEIWHFYGGDAFTLILLFPDRSSKEIIMGPNPLDGEHIQYVVPAGVWQAGYLNPGGRYALFGCTMAPGFTGAIFEAADILQLISQYPEHSDDILRLNINASETHLPDGFTQ
jgi:predicted cupin superfamily sugar epimerase